MSVTSQSSGQETTIVDNEVYDVLSTLHSKLEGIAAYKKYAKDGSTNDKLWQELQRDDERHVRTLMQQLNQFAQQGKLQTR